MAARVTRTSLPTRLTLVLVATTLLLAACGRSGSDPQNGRAGGAGGRGGGPKGPATVGFVVVQQGSAPLTTELPGRVSAYQISDVRPQVNGVILRRMFKEGSFVQPGADALPDRPEHL